MPASEVRTASVYRASPVPYALAPRTESTQLLHTSAQFPQDATGKNACLADARGQAEQVLSNIRGLVEAEGGTPSDVCKIVVCATSRKAVFKEPYPRLANPDWLVEIKATAALS